MAAQVAIQSRLPGWRAPRGGSSPTGVPLEAGEDRIERIERSGAAAIRI